MPVRSVMRLIKDQQANVAPKVDVAMAERVEEHVRSADDDSVRVQNAAPQFWVLPLIRLICARNKANGNGDVSGDDCLLLPCECDCWGDEPGDLSRVGDTNYSLGHTAHTHTLRDSLSVSRFIRKTAM